MGARRVAAGLRTYLVLLVLAAIVPALAVLGYIGVTDRTRERAEAAGDAQLRLALVTTAYARTIESARQTLTSLALVLPGPPDTWADTACATHAAALLAESPAMVSLGAATLDGTVVCSALPVPGPVSIGDRSYFRRAIETRALSVGEFQVGRITGKPSLNVALPVRDQQDRIQGVVFAALGLEWLDTVARSLRLPSEASLVLVDGEGTVLARYPETLGLIGRPMPDGPLWRALRRGGPGTGAFTGLDGIPRLYAFAGLGSESAADPRDRSAAAGLVAAVGLASAFDQADQLLARGLVGLALVASLALAAVWTLGERFVAWPVARLTAAARRLASGDLDVRSGLASGPAEIVRLARAFDDMASSIERLMDERRRAADDALAVNGRLRHALADVSDREATIRRQAERLELLNEFARSVGGTLDLQSIFALVVHHVPAALRSRWCAVVQLVSEEGRFRVAAQAPADALPSDWPREAALEREATRTAISTRAPCVVDDLRRDGGDEGEAGIWTEAAAPGALRPASEQEEGSLVCVPIHVNGAAWGALDVGFEEAGAVTPDCVDFLTALASHLAVALNNARLYGDLRAAMAETEAAQAQVIQQERLRAFGQMAAGIAHDLNNALAPVVGFSDLLLADAETLRDTTTVRRYLELISTGAQDAASIISRLREFYRPPEEGEEFAPVDLNRLAETSLDLTRPKWKDQAQALGRTIAVETDLREVPAVLGRESELREALTNLIFNAVDAMPEGGTITLRTYTTRRRADAQTRGEDAPSPRPPIGEAKDSPLSSSSQPAVVLEVSDTGIGMTEETRRRCLEPFYSTKGEHGTGLGLPMVYGTVRRHGGAIDIRSAPGRGTTVSIDLPAAPPATTAAPPAQARAEGARPLRVLVVDDEPLVRHVTTELVRLDGHTVETASTGEEALRVLATQRFDVVLTDRAMPGMGGDALAAAVKRAYADTPVILLTGFGDLMAAGGERPEGVDVVLGKPPTLDKLRSTLASVTG